MSAVLIALPSSALPAKNGDLAVGIDADPSIEYRRFLSSAAFDRFLPVANNGSYISRGDHYRIGSSSPSMDRDRQSRTPTFRRGAP